MNTIPNLTDRCSTASFEALQVELLDDDGHGHAPFPVSGGGQVTTMRDMADISARKPSR